MRPSPDDRIDMNAAFTAPPTPQALAGLKVIELGQLIAGPFAGKTLADFGAEVIKVEPPPSDGSPGGDPLRQWRMLHNGTSVWWQVQSRNKKSVVLDLRTDEGRETVARLIDEAYVLIENFKPGTMEKWGLGYEQLSARNPGLVMLRISGYGQSGPYRERPGFAVVAEAMGGMRYLNAEPGRIPVRAGVSLGDTLAGLHGVIGVLLALQARQASIGPDAPKGRGQVVDVALYEAVFNCMESLLPEFSAFGASIFKRLMIAIGRDDLATDAELATNPGRVKRVQDIDVAIGAWTGARPVQQVLDVLNAASVPVSRIYDAQDIAEDPHYRARGMVLPVTTHDGLTVEVAGIVPKLSRTPGAIQRRGPVLGEDTDEVLSALNRGQA